MYDILSKLAALKVACEGATFDIEEAEEFRLQTLKHANDALNHAVQMGLQDGQVAKQIQKTYLTTFHNDNPHGARSISIGVTDLGAEEFEGALVGFRQYTGKAKIFKVEETITEIGGAQ